MTEPRRLGRRELYRLLDDNGLTPSKALGQNFVADPNTVERIARLAKVGSGDRVIEIGAGLGSLTLALAATGARVTAVEIDRYLIPVLASVVPDSVTIIEADALTLDWTQLIEGVDRASGGGPAPYVLVANLPYNVATPVVMTLAERAPAICRMVVMVQREVAERLAAVPGTRAYAGVSVRLSYFASARIVGYVSPEVFVPKPHVASALVEIVRLEHPAVDPDIASYAEISTLVRAGFSGRRKMLRRSLAGLIDESGFAAVGVDPTARAETLLIADWGKLARWRRSQPNTPTPS